MSSSSSSQPTTTTATEYKATVLLNTKGFVSFPLLTIDKDIKNQILLYAEHVLKHLKKINKIPQELTTHHRLHIEKVDARRLDCVLTPCTIEDIKPMLILKNADGKEIDAEKFEAVCKKENCCVLAILIGDKKKQTARWTIAPFQIPKPVADVDTTA